MTESTQADTEMTDSATSIPSPLKDLYEVIRSTLTKSFAKSPPHTIQRLAELILRPRTHYRYLPSYLRALDRVVCVSSSANIFPLPQALVPPSGSGGLLNSASSAPAPSSLGSDESLGGALLTPIPWLKPDRMLEDTISPTVSQNQSQLQGQQSQPQNELKSEETEMVEGPNGVGRIETVSVVNGVLSTMSPNGNSNASPATSPGSSNGSRSSNLNGPALSAEESLREAGAVTQGELLRLEQEAGVVPVSVATRNPARSTRSREAAAAGEDAMSTEENADAAVEGQVDAETQEEVPHARGPEEIGAEDVGPGQERIGTGNLDLEKAVGRSLSHGDGSGGGSGEQAKDVVMEEADQQDTEAAAEGSKSEEVDNKEAASEIGGETSEDQSAPAVDQPDKKAGDSSKS